MEPLYRLEHQILPELILGEEKISPFMLGNHFSDICYDIINGFYDKEEFVAKPIIVKDNGKPAYYLVQFCFPFEEFISYNLACPRAYLLHDLEGKNCHYYTIEYDCAIMDSNGKGTYLLCGWAPNGKGHFNHLNLGEVDWEEDEEMRVLINMNNEYFGIV